jgi:hypothetical protein
VELAGWLLSTVETYLGVCTHHFSYCQVSKKVFSRTVTKLMPYIFHC